MEKDSMNPQNDSLNLDSIMMNVDGEFSFCGARYIGMIIIAVLAVIGNGLLVFTVLYHRHLRTNTNALIVSLAIADFLFAFPTVPLYIFAENASVAMLGKALPTVCLWVMSLAGIQLIITITTLFVLTLERYTSILYPLKHRKWAQRHQVILVISLVWLYSILMGGLPLLGWNSLKYHNPWAHFDSSNRSLTDSPRCSFALVNTGPYLGLLLVLHILPVSVWLPYMFTCMFLEVRRFVERKNSNGASPLRGSVHSGESPIASKTLRHQDSQQTSTGTRKSLRLLVVIAIYGVFSWLPTTIWYIVATRGFREAYLTSEMIKDVPLPSFYYHLSITLGFANSAINPYIFGLGNVPIRRAFFAMFRNSTSLRRAVTSEGQPA